jgi:hypothetical protein
LVLRLLLLRMALAALSAATWRMFLRRWRVRAIPASGIRLRAGSGAPDFPLEPGLAQLADQIREVGT